MANRSSVFSMEEFSALVSTSLEPNLAPNPIAVDSPSRQRRYSQWFHPRPNLPSSIQQPANGLNAVDGRRTSARSDGPGPAKPPSTPQKRTPSGSPFPTLHTPSSSPSRPVRASPSFNLVQMSSPPSTPRRRTASTPGFVTTPPHLPSLQASPSKGRQRRSRLVSQPTPLTPITDGDDTVVPTYAFPTIVENVPLPPKTTPSPTKTIPLPPKTTPLLPNTPSFPPKTTSATTTLEHRLGESLANVPLERRKSLTERVRSLSSSAFSRIHFARRERRVSSLAAVKERAPDMKVRHVPRTTSVLRTAPVLDHTDVSPVACDDLLAQHSTSQAPSNVSEGFPTRKPSSKFHQRGRPTSLQLIPARSSSPFSSSTQVTATDSSGPRTPVSAVTISVENEASLSGTSVEDARNLQDKLSSSSKHQDLSSGFFKRMRMASMDPFAFRSARSHSQSPMNSTSGGASPKPTIGSSRT